MGNCTGWATHCLRIAPPARVFYPCGLSSMGWSLGAVIGGKVGRPENTAIALTGDGSFLMNGTELVTAVRYRVGAVYIVLNDNYLGMVNHGEHAQSGGEYALDDPYFSLGDPDLVKFSESLGAAAYEVTKPGQLAAAAAPGAPARGRGAPAPGHRVPHRLPRGAAVRGPLRRRRLDAEARIERGPASAGRVGGQELE